MYYSGKYVAHQLLKNHILLLLIIQILPS